MEKKLVLVYLGILMMTFVMSAPPVQESGIGALCEISYPKYQFVKASSGFNLSIKVFDTFQYLEQNYSFVDCHLHITNPTGNHVLDNEPFVNVDDDLEVYIPSSVFSMVGIHGYNIHCNGTFTDTAPTPDEDYTGGCFVDGVIEVTNSGKPIDEMRTNTNIFLIMLFAGFGFFMFMVAGKLPQANLRNDEGRLLHVSHLKYLRFPMWGIGYFSFIATMFLAGSLGTAYLGSGIGQMLYFIAYLMMFAIIPMMYVFTAKIIEDVWYDKELRRNIKMGFEEDGFK